VKYKFNADGTPFEDYLGSPHPTFTFGFNTDLTYMGFDLNFFFQGSYGNKIFNATRFTTDDNGGNFNLDRRMLNAWSGPGSTNDPSLARMSQLSSNDNDEISDRYIEDGSYARLKTLQIGYSLPAEICKKIYVEKLRFYIGGSNLLTFTKYSGLDPEIGVGNLDETGAANQNGVTYSNLNFGVDRGTYPQARSFIFGVNVTL
jgi:TonB-dependent starch-binding outer membrane protein SusC